MSDPIILASTSATRASLLQRAGVLFAIDRLRVDEDSIKAAMLHEKAPARDIADMLAEAKAKRCSSRWPDRLVLGADQVLVCDGRLIDKAVDLNAATETLRFLRGKSHDLYSAAVIYDNNSPVWRHVGRARMVMRDFTDTFLQGYVERSGSDILSSVGCYHLEGEGAQLFSRVEGDYFTILGLPLLEILAYLRLRGKMVA